MELLINCPFTGIKAWTFFYLFYYLKIVLAHSYLNTYAINKVDKTFGPNKHRLFASFFSSHIPREDINTNYKKPWHDSKWERILKN